MVDKVSRGSCDPRVLMHRPGTGHRQGRALERSWVCFLQCPGGFGRLLVNSRSWGWLRLKSRKNFFTDSQRSSGKLLFGAHSEQWSWT